MRRASPARLLRTCSIWFSTEIYGVAHALLATACVFFSPPAIVASLYANTYPLDLLASASLGWIAARMWHGQKSLAPLAAVLVALFLEVARAAR